MGTQGRSQHSHTFDALTLLEDGAAAITATRAGQVGGSDRVLDFGAGPVLNQKLAYASAKLVVDVRVAATGTAPIFQVIWQISDDASGNGVGFDAGDTVINKVVLPFGDALAGSTADAAPGPGRSVAGVDTEHFGVPFRFGRLFVVAAGTTPSITLSAYLTDMHVN